MTAGTGRTVKTAWTEQIVGAEQTAGSAKSLGTAQIEQTARTAETGPTAGIAGTAMMTAETPRAGGTTAIAVSVLAVEAAVPTIVGIVAAHCVEKHASVTPTPHTSANVIEDH